MVDKKDRNYILINFFISRLIIYAIIYVIRNFEFTKLFDCETYINIANNGYTQKMQYAFFPLIPLIIRYLSPIGLLIINNICSLLSTFLFYIISKKYLQIKNPLITSLLWIWSPITIFTMIYYTESIFVFLTIFAYFCYKEKKYLLSGICIGLSVCSRSTGSILFFALFIGFCIQLYQHKNKISNLFKMYIPATIISCLYPIYLQIKLNNWKFFVDIQYEYWEKEKCNLISLFFKWDYIKNATYPFMRPIYLFDYIMSLVLIVLIIALIIYKIKDEKYFDIILYMGLTILMITSTCKNLNCPTVSYYRYLFGCYALIFLLPQKKYIVNIFKAISIIISCVLLCNIWFF